MKSQSLLYLRPIEKFEEPLRLDPPIVPYRPPLLGLIWTVAVLFALLCWGVGLWLFFMWRLS